MKQEFMSTIVRLVVGTLQHRKVSTAVLGVPAVGLLTTSDVQEDVVTAVAVAVALAVAEGRVAAIVVLTDGAGGNVRYLGSSCNASCHVCIGLASFCPVFVHQL